MAAMGNKTPKRFPSSLKNAPRPAGQVVEREGDLFSVSLVDDHRRFLYDLHGVVTYSDNARGSLSAHRKRVRQDIVERFAVCKTLLKNSRLSLKLLVGHILIFLLKIENSLFNWLNSFKLSLRVGPKNRFYDSHI